MIGKQTVFAALVLCLLSGGIASAETLRVVALKSSDIPPYNEVVEGFKKTCGCTLAEITPEDHESDAALQGRVLASNPGLILTVGLDALSRALRIKEVPVVYSMVSNPVLPDKGGRSIAGVSMNIPPEKFLEAITGLFPSAKRIGVVYDPKNSDPFMHEAERQAKSRGVQLVMVQVHRPAEVPSAIDGLRGLIDLLWMVPDATAVNAEAFKHMLGFSFRTSIPVFAFAKKYVEMGAAAGLHAASYDIGRQAGESVLRGLPGSGPSVRMAPRDAALVVNRKILDKLGTPVNDQVLKRAEHVR